jgi:hypothetical protein
MEEAAEGDEVVEWIPKVSGWMGTLGYHATPQGWEDTEPPPLSPFAGWLSKRGASKSPLSFIMVASRHRLAVRRASCDVKCG